MDEFYEYWELFADNEKYENVGKEIVKYKRNLQDPDISARDLPQEVIEFFQQHLITSPYPTWEILYHIIDIRNHEKNRLLEELVLNALTTLLDQVEKFPEQLDKQAKLYNLLSNIYISEWCLARIRDVIIPRLFDLKENHGLLDHVLLLALLSRSVHSLLTHYMDYERQQVIRKCQMKSLFLRTCYEKVHWVETLLDPANDDAISLLNHEVYQHLRIFRLILNKEIRESDVNFCWTELEAINANAFQPESSLELCYIELQRQKLISQFLSCHLHVGGFDEKMLSGNNIMNNLLCLQVDFSINNYEEIRNLLQANHELVQQQRDILGEPQDHQRTEIDLLNEYMIMKLYLNLIQSNEPSPEVVETNLHHIRILMKTVNDGKALFQLLRNIFTLIFLRFEHIRKTKRKRKNSEMQSGFNSNQNNSHTTDVSDATADNLQSGFVCLKTSLKAIVNSMRLFLMNMEVYHSCNDDLKNKFDAMIEDVDDTLWRLQIIDNEARKREELVHSVKDWILATDWKISNVQTQITSDDEKLSPKKKIYRKKLKKRPKIAAKTDENDEASDDPVEFQLVTDNSQTEISGKRTQSRSTESQRRVRSVISKLLMSPASLVAICVLQKDNETVSKIIQNYDLKESDAATEVDFINNFEETKLKLQDIVESFKKLSERQDSLTSSIEIDAIKKIAESGFEKAKFLNTLDKFTLNNKLQVRDSDVKIIEKAIGQNKNLSMYQRDLLNALPIVDFMISLACPFELNHSIYRHIMKQWSLDNVDDGSFGYRKFVKSLMDILTIFKNYNIEKSVVELLNEDIFTLEPSTLKKQLHKRKNTVELMKIDVVSLDKEESLIEILHLFDLFESDANLLARVICYVKNVRHLMKFQSNILHTVGINDEMMMDLDSEVAKIIFNQQYSPEQVENFAFNVNVNLVHALAVAGGGEFWSPVRSQDEKLLSLFHLSEIGAAINPELNDDNNVRKTYAINNMDILYYMKREGSFMVAYLVKEIQNFDYKTLKYEEPNFIERAMSLDPISTLMDIHENNRIVTVLKYDNVDLKLILKKIQQTKTMNEKLKILSSITERQWNRDRIQFNELRDSYIEMLLSNNLDASQENFVKLEEISNIKKFSELLLRCIGDVKSDNDLERLLRRCLNPKNSVELDEEQRRALETWMKKLKLYRKIVKMFESDKSTGKEVTWTKIKELADESPAILVNFLLNINTNLVLCLEFLSIHPLKQRTDELTKMWIESLNNSKLNDQHHLMFKIIDTFPLKNVIEFFDFSLGFINNLPSLVRVMNILNQNIDNVPSMHSIRYQKFNISVQIFECLTDCDAMWSLAARPLVILEQFLMNSKIEILKKVINAVRSILDTNKQCSSCGGTSLYQVGENLVYDFDAHHDDLPITNECLDLLLKLYAAKALDFQIIEVHSIPSPTDVSSIDSNYGLFQMPKEIPIKAKWIPDGDTNHCMSCKRQKFSLLTRRHHCRRCGRVVCSSCSQNRVQLEEVYNDMMVRVCLDCYQQMGAEKKHLINDIHDKGRSAEEAVEWKLTGDISADQMVRDEFNFEYSPNVGLCIAIINLHTKNDELAKFLIFHCLRLRLLLRPIRGKMNPEVDLILVAKMLKMLALSAKIRGADGEAIIDHADVVLKITENGCESLAPLIPLDPINSVTIRSIINDLIKVENWKMALELSVKWDRSGTAGVFSAWGVSAIKSGQYQFARNKISLALQPVIGSTPATNESFMNMLNGYGAIDEKTFSYKRISRSLPLLHEVLESLETTASKERSLEPLQSPFRSKASKKESSKNVLNVMDNLRKIVVGDYGSPIRKPSDKFEWQSNWIINTSYYDESMFYLLNYGGNVEFLSFLIKNNLVQSALRYTLAQQVPQDLFIQYVFVPVVRMGRLSDFMSLIKKMDETLLIWKDYIIAACKHLERKRAFNCLYHMQILTGDLVRAATTCIKFYLEGSGSYTELHAKSHHLIEAKNHLQTELFKLEKTELKKVEKQGNGRKDGLTLKWDLKTINTHINVITLQLEVSKYLAQCEAEGLPTIGLMPKVFMDRPGMKTLFGKNQEKIQVSIILLICSSIDSGFGISYKVIQECSLKSSKIYSTCIKYLAKNLPRLMEVEKLVASIKANASNESNVVDPDVIRNCDELVAMAVEIAYNRHQNEAKSQIDQLIKLIQSKKMKIQCYIISNQLKTAYMLSASLNNLDDIRRIMKQAEITRQENIRRLCEKKLFQQQNSDGQSQGSKSDINQL